MQEHLADEKYQMLKYLSSFKIKICTASKIFINHSLAHVEDVLKLFPAIAAKQIEWFTSKKLLFEEVLPIENGLSIASHVLYQVLVPFLAMFMVIAYITALWIYGVVALLL